MNGYRRKTITRRPPITDPARVLDRPEDWKSKKGIRMPAAECPGSGALLSTREWLALIEDLMSGPEEATA